jgi:hypothetical protein
MEILHHNATGKEVLHNNIVDSCNYCNFLDEIKPMKILFYVAIAVGAWLLYKKVV